MKKLYYVVESFAGDFVFCRAELEALSKKYCIVLISQAREDGNEIWPDGIQVEYFGRKVTLFNRICAVVKYFCGKECQNERKDVIKKFSAAALFESLQMFTYAEAFYQFFTTICKEKEFVYYTFWNDYSALAMSLHKGEYNCAKIASRIHGFDLYDERCAGRRQPFKSIINESENVIIFLGNKSRDYYLHRHLEVVNSKIVVNSLGTRQIIRNIEYTKFDGVLKIVSCSAIIPLKRVELLVKAIALLDINVEWTHYGGGELHDDVTDMAHSLLDGKSNIKWNFTGFVNNEMVRKAYAEKVYDIFITVSETEGAPISIMEAMSASIPIIATNVGEIAEMIDGCGYLLSRDCSIQDISNMIMRVYYDYLNGSAFILREQAYNNWLAKYSDVESSKRLLSIVDSL